MSHISECKMSINMIDEKTVKESLKILESEGYTVKTDNSEFWIDLRSKGAIHSYTNRGMGDHWSMIHIKKDESSGEFRAEGDPYSIRKIYEKALEDLTSSYKQAGIIQALKMSGFKNPARKTEKDKIKIKAKKW